MSSFGNIANVIDTEWIEVEKEGFFEKEGHTIEVGITTVNLEKNKIIKTYSIPIKTEKTVPIEITELTGWDNRKLNRQGFDSHDALRLIMVKHGICNRLAVIDCFDEFESSIFELLHYNIKHRLDVSVLFSLITGEPSNLGIEKMLEHFNMKFEGTPHRASVDSYNIARLFIFLQEIIHNNQKYLSSVPLR